MSNSKLNIGAVTIVSLSDATFRGPATDSFPDAPTHAWQCGCSVPSSAPEIDTNIGSFLVRSGDRTILIDTGMGTVPLDDSGSV